MRFFPNILVRLVAGFIAACLTKAFFKTFLPDPVVDIERRTMKEIQNVIQANMPLDELLFFAKAIPILSDDWIRFILADGHLLVKTRIDGGKERIADWKFEPL